MSCSKIIPLYIVSILISVTSLVARTFSVEGVVLGEQSRQPIPFVAVTVDGDPTTGAVSGEDGRFVINGVEPGIQRLVAQSLGYENSYSYQIEVNARTPFVEIKMIASSEKIDSVFVRPSLFRQSVESPVSMRRIGFEQIEMSPGANRDVSKIVQNYPGVNYSPAGYRNDLIVRGGSPSENRFYLDGIEIPNINHFSTSGASGGPVSILNADLIREVEFYSSAFPVQYGGALSSVLDIQLTDGNPDRATFKGTLGASEVSLSGSGHISDRATYIFSIRQSYLQFLFKMLGLPLLPNFIDGQFKIKYKLTERSDITLLGLMGIDNMTLNEEGTTETSEYILNYLPTIKQNTFVTGLRYRLFAGRNTISVVASHSYVKNSSVKYFDNDESNGLNYSINSKEQKSTLRGENRVNYDSGISLRYGAELTYTQYGVDSYTSLVSGGENLYNTTLGLFGYGLYAGVSDRWLSDRLTASFGIRFDANDFSTQTLKFWCQPSPRLSVSYLLPANLTLGAAVGLYWSMPPLTSLSYEEGGVAVNAALNYIGVNHYTLGLEWRPKREVFISLEGFYKHYFDMPIVIEDGIPLADLGDDYGVIGNEALTQTGVGRAYGVELMGQWQVMKRISLVSSLTLYRSEYAVDSNASFRPSSWDNRVILMASGTYTFKRNWSVGGKLSATAGSPYTPYDEDLSSQIIYWDITGQPAYDYSAYNTLRNDAYAQFDLRVDKRFYFDKWMLGIYLDIQNLFMSRYTEADILVSTGEVDPNDSSRYQMKWLSNVSDTMLPTIGITASF
ncbi:MAG: carboxypeptidase-like regulatory domain-containing protein [Rikenellaceae bacterium]